LSNAATVRAVRALGRKDLDHLARGGIASIVLSVLFSTVTVVLFLVMPEALIGAFIDPGDPDRPQIIAVGVTLLAVAAAFQLVDGLQVMALGLLRGVQDARIPMILAAVSYWVVGLPASYYLGFSLGLDGVGVWSGLVVGLALAATALLWRFWRVSLPRLAANGGVRVEF
jgi:MATE family multidrug resistance protein